MKLFDVDVSLKYITVKLDDKKYTVQFRHSLLKGIYDVVVYGTEKVEVVTVYPSLKEIIKEIFMIHLPMWLRSLKK